MTQNNLGNALETLGERETGTAHLTAAIAAFRAALEERARERGPVQWATSFGDQGVAMMVIADRTNDAPGIEVALAQIETAYETERSGGVERIREYFQTQLTKARTIRDRLEGRSGACNTVNCGAAAAGEAKKP